MELERLYGIQNGGNRGNQYQEAKPQFAVLANGQSDLAEKLGMSLDTLQNYKTLAGMIPELEELVNTGVAEYWIVEPEKDLVTVNLFQTREVHQYSFNDKIRITVLDDFEIDLREIKEEWEELNL